MRELIIRPCLASCQIYDIVSIPKETGADFIGPHYSIPSDSQSVTESATISEINLRFPFGTSSAATVNRPIEESRRRFAGTQSAESMGHRSKGTAEIWANRERKTLFTRPQWLPFQRFPFRGLGRLCSFITSHWRWHTTGTDDQKHLNTPYLIRAGIQSPSKTARNSTKLLLFWPVVLKRSLL